MPFLDTNSLMMTKPYNLDIKCRINSESYDQQCFFGIMFRGVQNFLLRVGGFFNKREYSGADWLVPLIYLFCIISIIQNIQGVERSRSRMQDFLLDLEV